MSRLVRILIAVAVLALPAAAAAIVVKTPVYVTNCHEALYKPSSITLSCGDGSTLLRKLDWTSWRPKSAHGDGQYAVNPCNPNCAAGRFKLYRVRVALSHPRVCSNSNHLVFNRAAITFVDQRPGKDRTMNETLGCPLG